jgi:signal transduction histidine kinase
MLFILLITTIGCTPDVVAHPSHVLLTGMATRFCNLPILFLNVLQSTIYRLPIILTAMLSMTVLLLYYCFQKIKSQRQHNRLMKQRIMLQEQQAIGLLYAEEYERSKVATFLHEGVGQMVSVARMNISGIESELAGKGQVDPFIFNRIFSLMDGSCRELLAISRYLMPSTLMHSGLLAAVQQQINKTDQQEMKIKLYTQGLDKRLNLPVEIILYRIIQEGIDNASRHASAGYLDISIIEAEDGISITLEDNGKGFDTKEMAMQARGGLQHMKSRISYLDGFIEIDASPGKGTLIAMHIPLEKVRTNF